MTAAAACPSPPHQLRRKDFLIVRRIVAVDHRHEHGDELLACAVQRLLHRGERRAHVFADGDAVIADDGHVASGQQTQLADRLHRADRHHVGHADNGGRHLIGSEQAVHGVMAGRKIRLGAGFQSRAGREAGVLQGLAVAHQTLGGEIVPQRSVDVSDATMAEACQMQRRLAHGREIVGVEPGEILRRGGAAMGNEGQADLLQRLDARIAQQRTRDHHSVDPPGAGQAANGRDFVLLRARNRDGEVPVTLRQRLGDTVEQFAQERIGDMGALPGQDAGDAFGIAGRQPPGVAVGVVTEPGRRFAHPLAGFRRNVVIAVEGPGDRSFGQSELPGQGLQAHLPHDGKAIPKALSESRGVSCRLDTDGLWRLRADQAVAAPPSAMVSAR